MRSESDIQKEIRLALAAHGLVFRTNSGEFWQGQPVYSKEFGQRVLLNLRKVSGLPSGFSDLLFLGKNGVPAFIETKNAKGRVREDQERFLSIVRSMGYRGGVARSVEDAVRIIGGDGHG